MGGKRQFRAGPALLLATALAAAGCAKLEVREEPDGDGGRQSSSWLRGGDSVRVLHGIQVSWYPDGSRRGMDIYVKGKREGYSLRWHPNGKLQSLEQYRDGVQGGEARFWDDQGTLQACASETEGCERVPLAVAGRPAVFP